MSLRLEIKQLPLDHEGKGTRTIKFNTWPCSFLFGSERITFPEQDNLKQSATVSQLPKLLQGEIETRMQVENFSKGR